MTWYFAPTGAAEEQAVVRDWSLLMSSAASVTGAEVIVLETIE